jgi:hypothetical protein
LTTERIQRQLTSDEVLRIANDDAARIYGDLANFKISIRLSLDGWHVNYDLVDADMQGGGPQYVIDAIEGTILSKKYYQ